MKWVLWIVFLKFKKEIDKMKKRKQESRIEDSQQKGSLVMKEAPAIRPFGQLDTPPCLENLQGCVCCTCLCPNPPS